MKKSILFIAAASALVLAGCNKQEIANPEFTEGKTISLTLEATRGEAAGTKTAISYNDEYASLESVWKEGDKVYVYSRKSGAQLGTLTQTGEIINQKSSATAQYATSYASFSGSVTLGAGDNLTDDFAFVYQGAGRSLDVAEGLLTYEIGTSETVAGLNAWDLAYTTGKIQGTANAASCAVSFSNKMAFGYFSTEGLTETDLKADYFNGFTLDVKTGTVSGTMGLISLPDNQAFYMPLIAGEVKMDCGKVWSMQNDKLGYGGVMQSKSFTAAAGSYYRLGRNADVPFGPVKFVASDWTLYETLKNSKFSVAAGKEVYFTQGNLQYIGSAAEPYWRIASDQYSYLGGNNGVADNPENSGAMIKENADVDLFGWGDVNPPFHGSEVNADYSPALEGNTLVTDWATKFNAVTPTALYADKENNILYPKNGGDYCVLTSGEWQYLLANHWWGFATVKMNDGNSKNGLVICPNNVDESKARELLPGIIYKSNTTQSGKSGAFAENNIDQATIDANGLLFLPAAGYRGGTVSNVNARGNYWSATSANATNAYFVYFRSTTFYSANSNFRYLGFSVRLASVVVPE